MFPVPKLDKRLQKKDEVLVIKTPTETDKIIAIHSKFLQRKTIYHDSINQTPFVIFTDKKGGHRAYYNQNIKFKKFNFTTNEAVDISGRLWELQENFLKLKNTEKTLKRLHSYNAFWFGLQSQYPNVRLIK